MIISFVAFYLLLFGRVPIADNAVNVLIVCFLFSNLIPISTVLLLKKTGKISDLDASKKEQRIFPLTLGIIYSGIAYLILTYMKADPLVRGLMFCYMTNTVFTIIITKYWKISIHAMGVAAPLAALWMAGFQFPFFALIILIAVSYSRVVLKAHTVYQVMTGSIAGLILTYVQLYIFFV
ncbi:MAG: PAP2 family protein [Candidatus Marinimicrobia bacterium]|nr:PAP2 family protein [Candidatus Neomarinimicrobiota bacterium]MCH7763613.1 PAP2 family protein [Candidatus Neomarinimicrobiota bacterium]